MENEKKHYGLLFEGFEIREENGKYIAVFAKEGDVTLVDCLPLIARLTKVLVNQHIQRDKEKNRFNRYISDHTLIGFEGRALYIQNYVEDTKFAFYLDYSVGRKALEFTKEFDPKFVEAVCVIGLSDISIRCKVSIEGKFIEECDEADDIISNVCDYISKGLRTAYKLNNMVYQALVDKSYRTCILPFYTMLDIEDSYGQYELDKGVVVECYKPLFKIGNKFADIVEDYSGNYVVIPDGTVVIDKKDDTVMNYHLMIYSEKEDKPPIYVSVYCGRNYAEDVYRHEKYFTSSVATEYIQIYVEDKLCKSLLFGDNPGEPIKKVSKDDVFETQSDSLIKLKVKSIIEMAKTIPW